MAGGGGGSVHHYLRYGSRLASNHSLENCRWSPSVARKTSFPALSMAARPNRSCRVGTEKEKNRNPDRNTRECSENCLLQISKTSKHQKMQLSPAVTPPCHQEASALFLLLSSNLNKLKCRSSTLKNGLKFLNLKFNLTFYFVFLVENHNFWRDD